MATDSLCKLVLWTPLQKLASLDPSGEKRGFCCFPAVEEEEYGGGNEPTNRDPESGKLVSVRVLGLGCRVRVLAWRAADLRLKVKSNII